MTAGELLLPVALLAAWVIRRLRRRQWIAAGSMLALGGASCAAGLLWPLLPSDATDTPRPAGLTVGRVYFPGDPPLVEFLLFAVIGFILPIGLFWALGKAVRSRAGVKVLYTVVRTLQTVTVALAVVVGWYADGAIAGRHIGEWQHLKRELARHAEIASRMAPHGGVLAHDELQAIRARMPTPSLAFAGFAGPVQIRMMSGGYPYVGVAYGAGRNAVFDPLTMVCTYAD